MRAEVAVALAFAAAAPEPEPRDGHAALAERHLVARHSPHPRVGGHADGERGAYGGDGSAKKLPPIDGRHSGLPGAFILAPRPSGGQDRRPAGSTAMPIGNSDP